MEFNINAFLTANLHFQLTKGIQLKIFFKVSFFTPSINTDLTNICIYLIDNGLNVQRWSMKVRSIK